ncbi:MAG: glycosyltransferase family 39 protein [Elusimicrobiota bacterium]|nr:glycosyltransferase family 39 protein [Elusimicrobiota bacterium]
MSAGLPSLLSQLQQAPAAAAVQFALAGLLLAALLPATALIAWARRRDARRLDLAAAGGCMLLGLAVRGAVEPFPGDIRTALDMGFMIGGPSHMWAAGYSLIQHALLAVFPASLETVARANVVLDTLSVGLVYSLARRLLRDPAAAAAAAAVYAFHPVAARFAASDSAHVLVTFCYLTALWLLGVWREEGGPRALLAAAGWWALACNARMEAVIFAPAAALIAANFASERPARPAHAAAACLAAAPFLVFPGAEILRHLLDNHGAFNPAGLFKNHFFMSPESPAPFAAAAVLGIGLSLRRSPWKLAALASAIALVALPSFGGGADDQTSYRYFLPSFALLSVLAGQGAAGALGHFAAKRPRLLAHPGYLAFIVLLIAALSAPWRGFLRKTWTHQLEFAFARRHLSGVPDGCAIVRRARYRSDSGLELSPTLSASMGLRHRWIDTEEFLKAPSHEGCAVYYQAASCHARDMTTDSPEARREFQILPECEQMRRRFHLEPLAEARLPAVPYSAEVYTVDPVPVGFYRITQREI